jgi:ribosomal protein S18 acetylase RimI-like enzyme
MEIRPATPDDVDAVVPMVEKICALHRAWDAAKFGFVENVAAMYRGWLTSRAGDAQSVFLVAAAPQRLAGFLIGTVESSIPIYRIKQFGFIHDLWVEEDYRHEGIGRQLAIVAVERFAVMGVRQVRLDTAAANDAARALFTTCGFRPSATEMLLEIPQENPAAQDDETSEI